jgi:hypothetical protein
MYDPVIDRFLQHLRAIVDAGETALGTHISAFFPVHLQDEALQHAGNIQRLLTGRVHACRMSPETKQSIITVENRMQSNGSYNNGENAIRTASLGDSTDNDDVESVFHF